MVAADYAGKRRELALKIGLGRRAATGAAPTGRPSAAPAGRKPNAASDTPKVPVRRGRPLKALSAAIKAAKGRLGSA